MCTEAVSYTHLDVYKRQARTSGRFVTEDEKLIDQKRHEIAQSLMKNFVSEMTAIGSVSYTHLEMAP